MKIYVPIVAFFTPAIHWLLTKVLYCPNCGSRETRVAIVFDGLFIKPGIRLICGHCRFHGAREKTFYNAIENWKKSRGRFASRLKRVSGRKTPVSAKIKTCGLFAILCLACPDPAFAGQGFGAAGDTISFFVNNNTTVGTWTAQALNVTGGITATGSMTALYYAHTSDLRLKTDIHPVQHALDKLLLINGVEFRWRKDGRKDMGVIAQNVAEIFPFIVHTNSFGQKSVEYDSLIGPMIEAIRELKSENDDLSLRMDKMADKLDAAKGSGK